MGLPQTPNPTHLYPQALQLKLYQAFIFSIPILFSIILFLLFYLFYLKRRASNLSALPPVLPRQSSQATPFISLPCAVDLNGELKDKLPVVLFDENLRARDPLCCVCLGEFEMKDQLHQVPSCKHVFHIDCIRLWLQSNSTCPLCRCSVAAATKESQPEPPAAVVPHFLQQDNENSNHHTHAASTQQHLLQQQLQVVGGGSNPANFSRDQEAIQIEGSSLANSCSRESGRSSDLPICTEHEMDHQDQESVVLHIPAHTS